MKIRKLLHFVAFAALLLLVSCSSHSGKKEKELHLDEIKLPPGFHISIFADHIENARSLALGAKGTVFVSTRQNDKVYALVDTNGDGKADKVYIIAQGLKTPNGVAFHNGALFIAQVDSIWRLDNIEDHLADPPKPVLVFDSLPHAEHHGWKYIAFGPDGKLYIPIGAPCNNCDSSEIDPRYASICRINEDGTGFEIFAHGVRNSVGFDWDPATKDLWFTDNGRDMMGDSIPPDKLNHASQAGMNFGYPYCQGGYIKDPEYGDRHPCSDFTPPVVKLDAHVASLGMKFYTGSMFPAEYKNQILIAEHGSWNRTVPIGYRISLVRFNKDSTTTYTRFAEGWLQNGKPWGRPVDLLQLKDGSILVSDDFGDAVYRISYDGK
jgi:glucose/arabinose dehydrogenase